MLILSLYCYAAQGMFHNSHSLLKNVSFQKSRMCNVAPEIRYCSFIRNETVVSAPRSNKKMFCFSYLFQILNYCF